MKAFHYAEGIVSLFDAIIVLFGEALVPHSYNFDKKMGQDFLFDRSVEIEANLNKVSEIGPGGQVKQLGTASYQKFRHMVPNE